MGVLEELEDVLLLLERLLPHFFFDVLNIYKSPGESSSSALSSSQRQKAGCLKLLRVCSEVMTVLEISCCYHKVLIYLCFVLYLMLFIQSVQIERRVLLSLSQKHTHSFNTHFNTHFFSFFPLSHLQSIKSWAT